MGQWTFQPENCLSLTFQSTFLDTTDDINIVIKHKDILTRISLLTALSKQLWQSNLKIFHDDKMDIERQTALGK